MLFDENTINLVTIRHIYFDITLESPKIRYLILNDVYATIHLKFIRTISKAFFVHLYSFHILISVHE